jgi:hypothetical protein
MKCIHCSKTIVGKRSDAIYCSDSCRVMGHYARIKSRELSLDDFVNMLNLAGEKGWLELLGKDPETGRIVKKDG